jgi:hypothetical protein
MELAKRFNFPGIEWFKHDSAVSLRCNDIRQPGSATSSRASDHDAVMDILTGISI